MMTLAVPFTVIEVFLANADFSRSALITVGKYLTIGVDLFFLEDVPVEKYKK